MGGLSIRENNSELAQQIMRPDLPSVALYDIVDITGFKPIIYTVLSNVLAKIKCVLPFAGLLSKILFY